MLFYYFLSKNVFNFSFETYVITINSDKFSENKHRC